MRSAISVRQNHSTLVSSAVMHPVAISAFRGHQCTQRSSASLHLGIGGNARVPHALACESVEADRPLRHVAG